MPARTPEKNPVIADPPERENVLRKIESLAGSIGCSVVLFPSSPPSEKDGRLVNKIRELAESGGFSVALIPDSGDASAPEKESTRKKKREYQLTERDIEIIRAVNRYRFLRTGQVNRLLFSGNVTKQSAQKRLRFLSDKRYGFLKKIPPFVQRGDSDSDSDTVFCLDRNGIRLLRDELGEPVLSYPPKNKYSSHLFLHHALEISEFRVLVELVLRDDPLIALHRFTADFELKNVPRTTRDPPQRKLRQKMRHPRTREDFDFNPDALIIFRVREEPGQQRLFFLEIDRGTESHEQIRKKVIAYRLYFEQKVYVKYGKFQRFRVLFQTNSPKRAQNIRRRLAGTEGEELVWVTDHSQVRPETILHGRIWKDFREEMRFILNPGDA